MDQKSIDILLAGRAIIDNSKKERENRLQLLDIEYLRAMEKNDVNELFKIASKKQLLRDATKSILFKKALSPEELKNISLDKILQDY